MTSKVSDGDLLRSSGKVGEMPQNLEERVQEHEDVLTSGH